MKSFPRIQVIPVIFVIACCGKHRQEPKDSGNMTFHGTAEDLPASSGSTVRAAAKDHSLPPYIRQSAVVFERVLDGMETNEKEVRRAISELSTTRNERTCQIWISMMKACEATSPSILPQMGELAKLEEQRREGTVKGMGSNSLRYLSVLQFCVKILTEFDFPEADREVEAFMKRFELKYGTTETGKHFLDIYRMEIAHSVADRESGAVLWKSGRESPSHEF